MVKFLFCLICLCGWGGFLEASPTVDAAIDSMSSQAHFPLEGTVTIIHQKEEKIDSASFTMESKPLPTSFVKDVAMSASSATLLTLYRFELPAQNKGLYVLPTITVKVGGQTYSSIPSTYEVHEETPSQPAKSSSSTQPALPVVFRLEATVKGPTTLYPGQRTKLFYRISYNRSIDLTRSELPMIHPDHFQKIGDVHIRDLQQQDLTLQDLTQEVEASELGTFQLGPSLIEGYAYTLKGEQKVYDSTLLKSDAPMVTLEVKPFPQPDQPVSFTGALGQIEIEASLLSSSSVTVGETLQLHVKIQGVSNLTELRLPPLQCQPGFSGFFQTSDLPPPAEVKDNAKIFEVELRPLTSLMDEIPPIEVSSFDPVTEKYVIQRTAPLALKIDAAPIKAPPDSTPLFTRLPSIDHWPMPLVSPLELDDPPVQIPKRKMSWRQTSWVLWLLPLGVALLLLQYYGRQQWQRRPKPQRPKSLIILQRVLKKKSLSLVDLKLLEEAFWQRLWEKGVLPPGNFHLEQFPQEEIFEEIRAFIFQLQALQYSSEKEFDFQYIKQKAQQLFKKVE